MKARIVRLGAIVVLVFVLVLLGLSLARNPNIDYSVIPGYLIDPTIRSGVIVTIELAVISQIIGIIIGAVFALFRVSQSRGLRTFSMAYVWLLRSVPILVQLIFWYNLGLLFPRLSIGIPFTAINWSVQTNAVISGFTAALIGLGLHESAYMAEIIRSGILGVGKGQIEAAQALGLTRSRALTKVVLPQAMRIVIPPTGNDLITMIKSTSLVSVIAGLDLLTRAENIYTTTTQVVELLIVACIWYLVIIIIASIGVSLVEQHFASRGGDGSGQSVASRVRQKLPVKFRSRTGATA